MYGDGAGNRFGGMATLASIAGVTPRVRPGLLVAGVTYRYPSVLAAAITRAASLSLSGSLADVRRSAEE